MNKSSEENLHPVTLRLSGELHARVEDWGAQRGLLYSEAARDLLTLGLKATANRLPLTVMEPLRWMTEASRPKLQRHECLAVHVPEYPPRSPRLGRPPKPYSQAQIRARRMSSECLGAPCPHAWKRQHGRWLLVKVRHTAARGDAFDAVESIPDATPLQGLPEGTWYAIPRKGLTALSQALRDKPRAVSVFAPNKQLSTTT